MHTTMRLLFLSFIILTSSIILPVFNHLEMWYIPSKNSYLYLLGDVHTDLYNGEKTIAQQKDLLASVVKKNTEGTYLIAEDALTYTGKNKNLVHRFIKNASSSLEEEIARKQREAQKISQQMQCPVEEGIHSTPLSCLIRMCQKLKITSHNAEIPAWAVYNPNRPDISWVTEQEFITELSDGVKVIENTLPADTKILAEHINQLLHWANISNKEKFFERASSIRSHLVEFHTLSKIQSWNHIKHGFICLGMTHKNVIAQILPRLGYQKIKSFGGPILIDALSPSLAIKSPSKEQQNSMLSDAKKNIARAQAATALDLKEVFEKIDAEQNEHQAIVLWKKINHPRFFESVKTAYTLLAQQEAAQKKVAAQGDVSVQ